MCCCLLDVHLFLSSSRTKPMMTAMRMALPMPNTYVSVMGAGVGVGAGVAAGASSTSMNVSACDGQYPFEPSNEA